MLKKNNELGPGTTSLISCEQRVHLRAECELQACERPATPRKCRLCTQQEITLNVGNSVVISQSVVSQGSVMQSYDLVPRVRSETGRREPWKRGWQS